MQASSRPNAQMTRQHHKIRVSCWRGIEVNKRLEGATRRPASPRGRRHGGLWHAPLETRVMRQDRTFSQAPREAGPHLHDSERAEGADVAVLWPHLSFAPQLLRFASPVAAGPTALARSRRAPSTWAVLHRIQQTCLFAVSWRRLARRSAVAEERSGHCNIREAASRRHGNNGPILVCANVRACVCRENPTPRQRQTT